MKAWGARLLFLVLSAGVPTLATAQRPSNRAILKLLRQKPAAMSENDWRKQRREAARESGQRRLKEAVPTLLNIVKKERFDLILEVAIDALGAIGDRRAIAPLRALLADPSLDSYVRDAVARALGRLERKKPLLPAPHQGPASSLSRQPENMTSGGTSSTQLRTVEAEHASTLEGPVFARLPPLEMPELGRDTIALAERLDLAVDSGSFRWDGGADQTTANLLLTSEYRRQFEKKTLGYTVSGAADLSYSLSRPPGGPSAWNLGHNVQVNPEVRYYPLSERLPQFFGQVSAGFGYGIAVNSPALSFDNRFSFIGDTAVAAGIGYGRVVDIGARLRLRRITWALKNAGLLKRSIPERVARDIIHAWYELRNRIASFNQLGYTLRILRDADLLIDESVDPATTYRMVRVLDDPQLDDRQSGILARMGYGYAHQFYDDANDFRMAFLYLTGELQEQLGTTRAVSAQLRYFWDSLDETRHGLSAGGAYAWYMYNRAMDPLGVLRTTIDFALDINETPAFDEGGIGYRLLGGGSYSRFFTRGSRVDFSARAGFDQSGALVIFSIDVRYGIGAGAFVAP